MIMTKGVYHIGNPVHDVERAAKKMKDRGVKVYDIPTVERPTGRGFYFFDPDGSLLQLCAPPKTASVS